MQLVRYITVLTIPSICPIDQPCIKVCVCVCVWGRQQKLEKVMDQEGLADEEVWKQYYCFICLI